MSTLYIRLPSKCTTDSAPNWLALPCPFAQVSHGGAIGRQGVSSLSDLSGTITAVQRVVLLLAASDVTLLRVKVPPMSAARLKAALPNLAEDQLISDPADCVVAAGGVADGLRTVAVVQRAWIDILAKTLIKFGAHRFSALPAQLCLPSDQTGSVSAAINEHEAGIDLILRLTEQDGIGLAIKADQHEPAAQEVIRTLCALVPEAPIALYVPQSALSAYQEVVNGTLAWNERISVSVDNWTRWVTGARGTPLDLMAGLGTNSGHRLDWHAWRWPLALAAAVLLINVSALNIEWWRMKSEASSLRSAMTQIYRSAYPSESVIIDPLAQMQQKIAIAKRDSGMAAPDDFTAMTAAFGEAWASVTATLPAPPSIAALGYRDRSLSVRMRDREAPTQQMRSALAERALSLELAPEQSGAVVWKIRSAK